MSLISRRQFMGGVGAICAGPILHSGQAFAQQVAGRLAMVAYSAGRPKNRLIVADLSKLATRTLEIEPFGHQAYGIPGTDLVLVCPMERPTWRLYDAALMAPASEFSSIDGYVGGGHAVLHNGALLCVERSARRFITDEPQYHGRISVRDPKTLKEIDGFSTYGLKPHDLRVMPDGKHVAIANYGSLNPEPVPGLPGPPVTGSASITIIEISSGKQVGALPMTGSDVEIRHLEVSDKAILAIPTRSVAGEAMTPAALEAAKAYPQNGRNSYFVSAGPLLAPSCVSLQAVAELAAEDTLHGLSSVWDADHRRFMVTYPGSGVIQALDAVGRPAGTVRCRDHGLEYPTAIVIADAQRYAAVNLRHDIFFIDRETLDIRPERIAVDIGGNSHATVF